MVYEDIRRLLPHFQFEGRFEDAVEINAGNIVIHSCAHTQNTKGNSSSQAQSRLTEFALAFEYDDQNYRLYRIKLD